MIASYDYAAAQPFTLATLPEVGRKIVTVREDGSHNSFSGTNIIRYIALYGEDKAARWAYAKDCSCEVCTWEFPDGR